MHVPLVQVQVMTVRHAGAADVVGVLLFFEQRWWRPASAVQGEEREGGQGEERSRPIVHPPAQPRILPPGLCPYPRLPIPHPALLVPMACHATSVLRLGGPRTTTCLRCCMLVNTQWPALVV